MNNDLFSCHHCGLPIPAGTDIRAQTARSEVRFCCHGCRGAFQIISGAGLDRFYRLRDWPETGIPEGVYETRFADDSLRPYVVPIDERRAEVSFLVDGIRCASCVWLLERIMQGIEGIVEARVNYGSHRARVVFDPGVVSPEKLCAAIGRIGYLPRPFTKNAAQKAAAREQKTLLIRFGTAAFLSMQLMGYSLALYAGYFQGIDPGIRTMIQYFAAAVTTPVVFYSGWPFISGALRSLVNRAPNMDLLIALGVLTAYFYSLFSLFQGGEVYFDTAAMIVTLILLGRLFENAARNRSQSGIDKLLQLAPDTAHLVDGDTTRTVQSVNLKPGDLIRILPGERVPVDAVLASGASEFDESTITGESLPVSRRTGDPVSSGTLNLTAVVTLRVSRVKAESFVSRMNHLVEEAQFRKAPVQSLADRVAAVFVPAVIALAAGTWAFWAIAGAGHYAATLNAVAVLVVACPCALGLATPTAVLVSTGRAAAAGILFRGGDILEASGRVDVIAFDKTGTLTHGRPTVTGIEPAPGFDRKVILAVAAAAAAGSTHPLAVAISRTAREENLSVRPATAVETVPGRGLVAAVDHAVIRVGSRRFLEECRLAAVPTHNHGVTEVHVARDDVYLGTILFRDPLRKEAGRVIRTLRKHGLKTVLLTGDREEPTRQVVRSVGIESYRSGMRPEEKAATIEDLQQGGQTVMMVGDGINDAPALSRADVGCAMSGGTDIALETSDLVLTRADLDRLVTALSIARQALRTIRQNLFWAFSYNIVAIPLAFSGLLAPVWAAAAMATSSVIVIGNSLRISRPIKNRLSNGPDSN